MSVINEFNCVGGDHRMDWSGWHEAEALDGPVGSRYSAYVEAPCKFCHRKVKELRLGERYQ